MASSPTPTIFAKMIACTSEVGSRFVIASFSLREAAKTCSTVSASSNTLFSTLASLAWATRLLSTLSSSPLMASSKLCVISRVFFPAADTFRSAFSARPNLDGGGFFTENSSLRSVTLVAMSSGRGTRVPRKARTSARPTLWKPSQSRIKLLPALSHVGMCPTMTQSLLARVMATFILRQSATKPTSPRRFARTRLMMITSRSLPWKASTVATWMADAEAPLGSMRWISLTWAP
mmetsp:Transcript_8222/g.22750  ORF Transcript_8222/g.22750 Transcript_8222/m.22750 type:complete len:234 (-) Transcript_8222:2788-3489(-)